MGTGTSGKAECSVSTWDISMIVFLGSSGALHLANIGSHHMDLSNDIVLDLGAILRGEERRTVAAVIPGMA